jgi:oxygen-dependent protoporphyrinogen oxidase
MANIMPKVIVIGAGISGLTVAYRLQQLMPHTEITVFEQNQRPGGTVWTQQREGFCLEAGPNGFLDTKPTTLELCRELGLHDQLVSASDAAARNRFLFVHGRLKLLPNSLASFLASDLLSWRGKISLLAERFRRPGPQHDDESIDAFARRRAGAEAALLADALVTGIYAGDPALLSLPACFPRFAELECAHGSVLKGMAHTARMRRREARARGETGRRPGKLWSCRDGLGLLIDTLVKKLQRPPFLGVIVQRIEQGSVQAPKESRAAPWLVRAADGRVWPADAVVLACPAYCQAALVAALDRDLADLVGSIPYNRVAVVGLGYRRSDVPISVAGFGFIAPQKFRGDVLGVQWCSSIFPGRAPADAVLLRAICGGWHRAEIVGCDDDRLLAAVRAVLHQAMGITTPPFFQQIIRWDRAIPQYHLGHRSRVIAIEERLTRHPGLFIGGNAYYGVALNDCTEQGRILAEKVRDHLQSHRSVGTLQ